MNNENISYEKISYCSKIRWARYFMANMLSKVLDISYTLSDLKIVVTN